MATNMIDVEPAKHSKRELQQHGLRNMKYANKHLCGPSIEAEGSDLVALVATSWFG